MLIGQIALELQREREKFLKNLPKYFVVVYIGNDGKIKQAHVFKLSKYYEL